MHQVKVKPSNLVTLTKGSCNACCYPIGGLDPAVFLDEISRPGIIASKVGGIMQSKIPIAATPVSSTTVAPVPSSSTTHKQGATISYGEIKNPFFMFVKYGTLKI